MAAGLRVAQDALQAPQGGVEAAPGVVLLGAVPEEAGQHLAGVQGVAVDQEVAEEVLHPLGGKLPHRPPGRWTRSVPNSLISSVPIGARTPPCTQSYAPNGPSCPSHRWGKVLPLSFSSRTSPSSPPPSSRDALRRRHNPPTWWHWTERSPGHAFGHGRRVPFSARRRQRGPAPAPPPGGWPAACARPGQSRSAP